jgi:OOP family OmpA-OmpF porin
MFRSFALFSILLASLVSASYAAEPLQNGFFIGGSVGSSELDDDGAFNGLSFDDSDTAFGILAGYKFNKNFAVEARYTDTGSFEVEFIDIDTEVISIHAVGIIPFANGWSIYGQLGLGRVNLDAGGLGDDDETVGSAGLGVSYNATENLSFAFQVDAYAWEEDDLDPAITTAQLVARYAF